MTFQHARLYRNKSKSENPPHIFAIAEAAYREMNHMHQSQCVVISGESGSGKTESANLLVRTRSILLRSHCHLLRLTIYFIPSPPLSLPSPLFRTENHLLLLYP